MGAFEKLTLYNIITLVIVTLLLILCKKKVGKERTKDLILKISSIAVVVIHMSSIYYHYFFDKVIEVEDNMFLPIYPCNIVMWLLVIVAFMRNKESKWFKLLAGFCFLGGTVCGLIGVIANINYLNNPNFLDFDIMKGLVSHDVMIFSTLYLGIMGYVEVDFVNSMKSNIFGLLLFCVIGGLINLLYWCFGLDDVNAMFMISPPFEDLPFINFFTIGIGSVIILFIGLNIYELIAIPKEKRWLIKFLKKRK